MMQVQPETIVIVVDTDIVRLMIVRDTPRRVSTANDEKLRPDGFE
jgi:hypothetical protein